MEFQFDARVVVTMDHKKGSTTSKHVKTDFNIDVSKNLDKKQYLTADEAPTKAGSQALSITLVHGLIGNIHLAHEKGFRDSAEHLRWIIAELEKGFVAITNVTKSTFDKS